MSTGDHTRHSLTGQLSKTKLCFMGPAMMSRTRIIVVVCSISSNTPCYRMQVSCAPIPPTHRHQPGGSSRLLTSASCSFAACEILRRLRERRLLHMYGHHIIRVESVNRRPGGEPPRSAEQPPREEGSRSWPKEESFACATYSTVLDLIAAPDMPLSAPHRQVQRHARQGKAILMLRARSYDQTTRMCSQSNVGERVDGHDEK